MAADPPRDWQDRADEEITAVIGRAPRGTTWREYYANLVASLPPLTDAQRERLALLLAPEGGRAP